MRKNQHGFSVVEIVIVIAVLAALGVVGWKVWSNQQNKKQPSSSSTPATEESKSSDDPGKLLWQQTANGWQAMEQAPACPQQPIMKSPADLSKATSILYPGQTRGGNYKPHGGMRFDNATGNAITVTAPIDAYLVRGTSYLAEGEVQYTFDAMNNCGVMYRVGHLRELPANLQKIADTWPAPSDSSATHSINPPVLVKQGETLATKVGILATKNTFFDWGVYDYRAENEASKSPAYQAAHTQDKELSWHAVCWLKDWLPTSDTAKIASLPAGDPTSAKTSDYCK